MLVSKIVRGSVIELASTFEDVDGNEETPTAVDAYFSYLDTDDERTVAVVEMEANSAGEWIAVWDSSVANPGRLHWSVRATEPNSADDGVVDLVANLANPDPESA